MWSRSQQKDFAQHMASLEISFNISPSCFPALHSSRAARTQDRSRFRGVMQECLVTVYPPVGKDFGRTRIQEDAQNSKSVEGQGNFLLWKWEKGTDERSGFLAEGKNILSELDWERGTKESSGCLGRAGKAPDLESKQSSLNPSIW